MVPLGHPEVKGVFLWRQLSRDIQGHTRACMEKGPSDGQYQVGSLEAADPRT